MTAGYFNGRRYAKLAGTYQTSLPAGSKLVGFRDGGKGSFHMCWISPSDPETETWIVHIGESNPHDELEPVGHVRIYGPKSLGGMNFEYSEYDGAVWLFRVPEGESAEGVPEIRSMDDTADDSGVAITGLIPHGYPGDTVVVRLPGDWNSGAAWISHVDAEGIHFHVSVPVSRFDEFFQGHRAYAPRATVRVRRYPAGYFAGTFGAGISEGNGIGTYDSHDYYWTLDDGSTQMGIEPAIWPYYIDEGWVNPITAL